MSIMRKEQLFTLNNVGGQNYGRYVPVELP